MRITRFFLLGLWLVTACTTGSALSETDEAAIYAAVIERTYSEDDTFGGTFQAPDLYLLTTTDDSAGDPQGEPGEPRSLSPAVQEEITRALAHLPTRIHWVADASAVPLDPTTGAVSQGGALLTLGNLHPRRDGAVLVPSSITIAPLAAGGQTYVLERADGVWRISGTTGVQWIS